MKRIRQLVVAGMLGVGALAACFSNDLSGATVTGTYTLRSVNGAALPYLVSQSGGARTEQLADSYTLYQGSTYSQSGQVRTTTAGQASDATVTSAGTYALQGTSITLARSDAPGQRVGTIAGKTMTFVEAGVTWVYRK